jgi:hypothetical protein
VSFERGARVDIEGSAEAFRQSGERGILGMEFPVFVSEQVHGVS